MSSTEIGCSNCSTQKQADGSIRKYHAMVGAGIVKRGRTELLPLPPEFIRPQDGHGKQDCEGAAANRWLQRVGPWASRLKPVCEAIRDSGGNFLFTCKPGSHFTLSEHIHGVAMDSLRRTERVGGKRKLHFNYRWMNDLPFRVGPGSTKVSWLEVTVFSETGEQTYHGTFATDITITRDNIAELAECARTRWAVENSVLRELKKFSHLERNFGYGKSTLASVLARFNMIALLIQSACQMVCDRWKAARRWWVARYQMMDQLKILTNYVIFNGCGQRLETIPTNERPERPQ